MILGPYIPVFTSKNDEKPTGKSKYINGSVAAVSHLEAEKWPKNEIFL